MCQKSTFSPKILNKIDFLNKSLGLSLEIQMKLNISLKNLKTFICKGSHQKFSKDLSKHL